jgi:hypothetical protein
MTNLMMRSDVYSRVQIMGATVKICSRTTHVLYVQCIQAAHRWLFIVTRELPSSSLYMVDNSVDLTFFPTNCVVRGNGACVEA